MNSCKALLGRFKACPIIQAPMAGTSTPQLAAAASNAGALGSIGIGASSVAQSREMIRETRSLTSEPFNVNVFCHRPPSPDTARDEAWLRHLAPVFDEMGAALPSSLEEIYKSFVGDAEALEMLLQERPAVASFHFGLPGVEALAAMRDAGIVTMATATNLEEARLIGQAGIDIVIAQGIEAGGHRGMFDPDAGDERLSTTVLARLLVEKQSLPVVAAGGIMDGRGIQAALALGAVAAQLGTAFVLCPESAATPAYRENLRGPRSAHTRLTPAISGRPARGIVNRLVELGEAAGAPRPAQYPYAYDAAKQLHAAAARKGIHEFAAHWAGQGAPLAREMPAGILVSTLMKEVQA